MQAPQGINLRSHHSLKSSTINDVSSGQHMNPLSSRLGVGKKISVNSKNEQYNKYKNSLLQHTDIKNNNKLRIPKLIELAPTALPSKWDNIKELTIHNIGEQDKIVRE